MTLNERRPDQRLCPADRSGVGDTDPLFVVGVLLIGVVPLAGVLVLGGLLMIGWPVRHDAFMCGVIAVLVAGSASAVSAQRQFLGLHWGWAAPAAVAAVGGLTMIVIGFTPL